VHEEVVAGARVVRPGVQPGQAVGHGVHADQQLGAEVEAGEVVGDRAPDQVDEDLPQRRADVPLGGLLDRQRLGQPGRGEVGAQGGQFGLERVVGGHVGGGEELGELRPGARRVAAEEQVGRALWAGGGQEVVRVAAQHRDADVERGEQLRRHQPEQVGAGGVAQAGHLREGVLRPGGPADHLGGLQHQHVEPGAGEHDRGHQTVVPGPDDHHVGPGRQLVAHAGGA
jgi:hypothetical protein